MPLRSHLFRDDRALEACAVHHAAHVTRGARGMHVAKIQAALADLDGAAIDPGELAARYHGASTAAAVLAYKRKRKIINHSYQTTADDVVGKMTVAAMDEELLGRQEAAPPRYKPYCERP